MYSLRCKLVHLSKVAIFYVNLSFWYKKQSIRKNINKNFIDFLLKNKVLFCFLFLKLQLFY